MIVHAEVIANVGMQPKRTVIDPEKFRAACEAARLHILNVLNPMIDWTTESPLIEVAAKDYAVDPAFIKSIRQQENGPPGLQFGVKGVQAPTYHDQLTVCCFTVAHRLTTYAGNPLTRGPISHRLVYTEHWIEYFASIWAPFSDSPMNQSWLPNVLQFYAKWMATG